MSRVPSKAGIDPGKVAAPYDAAEFLRTPEEIAAYLEAIFEDYGDNARVVAKALGDVARAQGMQKIARETGLNREGLYQAFSGKGNPSFDTVLKVMRAVGVELRPKAARQESSPAKSKGLKSRGARLLGRKSDTGEFIAMGSRGAQQGRKRA
ncbi:addiction module antidote protein [Taklimakanibacter lacteus]|uniref:addiction module antidote protein n=1 Tax=Taklimakanibacter lacteus TaxID=2268456 RepID=UPI000E66F33B